MPKPKGSCTMLGRALLTLVLMSCVTLILATARVHGSIHILQTSRQLAGSDAGAEAAGVPLLVDATADALPAAQGVLGAATPGNERKAKAGRAKKRVPIDTAYHLEADGLHGQMYMEGTCWARRNTRRYGEMLLAGSEHLVNTTADCCSACLQYQPSGDHQETVCNAWVYCDGTHPNCTPRECTLFYQPRPWDMPVNSGPDVGTISGLTVGPPEAPADDPALAGVDRSYHVVVSAQGQSVHWQMRINYYHYKKAKRACAKLPICHMGGYTRLLHSGKPDDLMYEIPTYVVDKLPEGLEDPTYLALNRPYAFMQWSKQAVIPEKYVLMMEPDHIWVRPMPNLMKNDRPTGWPFWYMEPSMSYQLKTVRKYVGPLTREEIEKKVAPTGSSPMFMTMADLRKVAPLWLAYGTLIHADKDAVEVWGFVHEMYAFIIGMYHAGIHDVDLDMKIMSQPPYGPVHLEPFYLLHYTYAWEYDAQGNHDPRDDSFYRYDKRNYYESIQPRKLAPPPNNIKNEQVWFLYDAFVEAMNALPAWDSYEEAKAASQLWNGVLATSAAT
ncbi:hypothetical protein ACKKBG_A18980 [Auxenochlorella protothecoides x Auxenochlorella symbiontica]